MKNHLTRRGFIRRAAAGSAALTWLGSRRPPLAFAAEASKPALLGGVPVHQGGWAPWPKWLESWEPAVVEVLRSGKWYRGDGGHVAEFEAGYATVLARAGDASAAVDAMYTAVQLEPNNLEYRVHLAELLMQSGKREKVREA